ncbi:hypothetical protein [Oceanobacillus chungangensis]|uniref:Uncharacterized protein n=1 Tax=Oceanobacillus chungangensis TaxID=1229152 RepID=A0A3D8PIM9_9BACI|nr:hypothetical protein [Oceanobacillus chungangensis]RDW15946.1 hypothetical protein CWR45_15740 [Oceanobacillus chungangensis]
MKEYVRADYVNSEDIHKYLSEGWEIIGTTKEFYEPETTRLSYHVGLPARALVGKLQEVIRDYERFGLKSELFKKIAEENEEDINDYSDVGRVSHDKTPTYMTKYERTVHESNKRYYKNYTQEEIENRYSF